MKQFLVFGGIVFTWAISCFRSEAQGSFFFGDSNGIDFVNKIAYQTHWQPDETISSFWLNPFYVGDLLLRRARSGDRLDQPGGLFNGSWPRNSQRPDLFRATGARDAHWE